MEPIRSGRATHGVNTVEEVTEMLRQRSSLAFITSRRTVQEVRPYETVCTERVVSIDL
jgi:hypothetical protein